jgi:hypothetical protein
MSYVIVHRTKRGPLGFVGEEEVSATGPFSDRETAIAYFEKHVKEEAKSGLWEAHYVFVTELAAPKQLT